MTRATHILGVLLVCFGLAFAGAASAQTRPLIFQRLSVEDGLSQSSALALALDREGFLWIGTYDGLNRYDGLEFKTYRTDPDAPGSISDVNIRSLLVDSQGTLWVGTKNGGLNRYDRKTDSFTVFQEDRSRPDALPGNQIRSLFEDSRHRLWVGGNQGLALMDREAGTFAGYPGKPGSPGFIGAAEILSLAEDSSGALLVGADCGLFRLDPDTGESERLDLGLSSQGRPGPVVLSIMPEDGKIWAGTEANGLILYDPATRRTETFLPGRAVWTLLKDSGGIFWAGSSRGLARRLDLQDGGFSFDIIRNNPMDPRSLSGDDVVSLLEDDSGILWVGVYADGLNKLNPRARAFGLYAHKQGDPHSLSGNEISAITVDRTGILWVGTRNSGLNRIDRAKNAYSVYANDPADPDSLSQNEITCLLADSKGRLWAGTADNGLNLLDPQTGKWKHFRYDPDNPQSLSQDKIWWIFEGSDGYLWIGTSKKGLNRFDPETGVCKRYQHDPDNPQSISHDRVRHIFEGSDGYLWIGTNGGLNRFDRTTETFTCWKNDPGNPRSLSNDRVTPILEDAKGYLWVGTDNGLNRFDRKTGTFMRVTEKDGLSNDGVQGLLMDKEGNLWLSAFRGLSKYDPQSGLIRNYAPRDGLQGIEFWMNSYFMAKDGEMFFGGLSGMNAFYPDQVRWNRHVPPVVFTDISVMNEPLAGDENPNVIAKLSLPYAKRMVALRFAALDFSDPDKNRFSYKLEGFDPSWIQTNGHTAVYANLSPGEYVFRVKAANDDGVWNETGKSLVIAIIPPFWMTWWFRLIGAMALLALLSLGYRWRVGALNAQRRHLSALVEERARELKAEVEERRIAQEAAIRAKLEAEKAAMAKSEFLARMSHEIRTPINVILGMGEVLAETGLSDEQRKYVAAFKSAGDLLLSVINDVLDFSKIEAGRFELERAPFDLRAALDDVSRLVRFKAERKGLTYSLHVAPFVPEVLIGDSVRLRQILMNLLGNAVKYTSQGEVTVRVEMDGGTGEEDRSPVQGGSCALRFSVRDTGPGIPEADQEKIFQSFFQSGARPGGNLGGTGLGLAISKRLVEFMDGRISVVSVLGQGSEFVFTAVFGVGAPLADAGRQGALPMGSILSTGMIGAAGMAGMTEMADMEDMSALEGGRVEKGGHVGRALLAEDNKANRSLIQLFVSGLPVKLIEAEDGVQAVRLFKEAGPFDIVLMDIEMPVMDGVEAVKAIRELERAEGSPSTPIVALTAHAFSEQRDRCVAAGCDDFIAKPMSKARLIETLRRYVKGLPAPAEPLEAAAQAEEEDEDAVVYVRERLVNVLPVFLQSVDDVAKAIAKAVEEKDFEKLFRHGHTLKGSAASFGFTRLSALGAAIQTAAERRDAVTAAARMDELTAYMDRLEVKYR